MKRLLLGVAIGLLPATGPQALGASAAQPKPDPPPVTSPEAVIAPTPPPPQAFAAYYKHAWNTQSGPLTISTISCQRATRREGYTCSIIFKRYGSVLIQVTILWPSLRSLKPTYSAVTPSAPFNPNAPLPCSIAETVPPIVAPGSGPAPPPGSPPPGCTPG
jgi:hypothetical protein